VTKLKKNYALTWSCDRWWIFNFRSSLDKCFNDWCFKLHQNALSYFKNVLSLPIPSVFS